MDMLRSFFQMIVAVLPVVYNVADAAICGETEFFEYKFKPIEVSPVNEDEVQNSKKRCGEKLCDVMIMLNGESRCKKGDHGDLLSAPGDKNKVSGPEFKPTETNWKVHNEWKLSDAKSTPIKIEVCDEDGGFRGRNDKLINTEHQALQPGCHTHKKADDEKDHKWFIEYELCCRPIGGGEQKGTESTGGGRKGSFGGGRKGAFGGGRKGSVGGGRKGSIGGGGGFSEEYPVISSTPLPSPDDRYRGRQKSLNGDRTSLGGRKNSAGRYDGGGSLGGSREPYDSGLGTGTRTSGSRNGHTDIYGDILNRSRDRYKGRSKVDDILKGSRDRYRGSSRNDDLLRETLDRHRGKSRIDRLLERTNGRNSRYRDLLERTRDRHSGGRGTSGYTDYLRDAGRDVSPTRSRSRYNSDKYLGDAGKYGTGGRKNYGTGTYDYGQWRSKYRS